MDVTSMATTAQPVANPGIAFSAIAGTNDQVETSQKEHYPALFQLDQRGRLWALWRAQDPDSDWELVKPLPGAP